jgi:carboxyl-terminal processing protease
MIVRSLLPAAVAAVLLSAPAAAEEAQQSRMETYELLNLFGDVFERVRADYVEETTDEELIEAAVNGMLSALDPHSSYLDQKKYEDMKVQTQGSFGGLGIEVTMEGGAVKVVSPIDDTPAFKAGLQPGDLITHIDGQEILGMTLAEAVEKMRGKIGTPIKLSIRRADREPFDVTLTRDVIKIRSVRSRLEGRVGYLRISSFSEQTDEGVRNEIAKLKKEAPGGLQGLVLDLRNNPGGLLAQAVAVSDDFLEQGEIVSTRARKTEDAQRFNARAGEVAKDLPIVVLINAGTASASEIVAGALQDHGRAILLGTKSFGKGSVQTIIPLVGHGAMRLTTARYYTPSGRSIQAVGIEPDIVVEQAKIESLAQAAQRREADLRGALDLAVPNGGTDGNAPAGGGEGGAPGGGSAPPQPRAAGEGPVPAEEDYQLVRALDLVRGLSLFSEKMSQRAP